MRDSNRKTRLLSLGIALTSFIGASLYAKSALAKPKKAVKKKTEVVKSKGGEVKREPNVKILKIETNQNNVVPNDKQRIFTPDELAKNTRIGVVYHQGVGSYISFSSHPTRLLVAPVITQQYFNLYLNEISSPYRSQGDTLRIASLNNKQTHYIGFSQPFSLDARHIGASSPEMLTVRRPLWAINATDAGYNVSSPLQYIEHHLDNIIGAMLYCEGLIGNHAPYGGHANQQILDLNMERVALVNVFFLRLYDSLNKYAEKNKISKLRNISIQTIKERAKTLFLGEKGQTSPWNDSNDFETKFKQKLSEFENKTAPVRAQSQLDGFLNNDLWQAPVLNPNCRYFIHPDSMKSKAPSWVTGMDGDTPLKRKPNLYLIGKTIFSDHVDN